MARTGSSIRSFCDRYDICRATFYNIKKQGKGPRIIKVGRRVVITDQSEDEWIKDRERDAASPIPSRNDLQTGRPKSALVMMTIRPVPEVE